MGDSIFNAESEVTREIIIQLSHHARLKVDCIGFGRELGVRENELAEIEHRAARLDDKLYSVLSAWMDQCRRGEATMGALCAALQRCGYSDITDHFGVPPDFNYSYRNRTELADTNNNLLFLCGVIIVFMSIVALMYFRDLHTGEDIDMEKESRDKFIGRKEEIQSVIKSWDTFRMFGIYAYSGIGKSRFARHVTEIIRTSPKYAFVHFRQITIDMRGVRTADDVKLRFLAAMKLGIQPTSYADEIHERTKGSRDVFVFIIDNAEDIDQNQELKDDFLTNCEKMTRDNKRLTILLTSRVRFSSTEPTMKQIDLPPLNHTESAALLRQTAPEVDFANWTDVLVERCGGNAQIIKLVATSIREDKMMTIAEYVEQLQENRLLTINDEQHSKERRTEGMVNLFLSRMSPDEKIALGNISYMYNTFSREAATAMVDESNYPRAYNKHIRPLRRRSLIDIIQDDDGSARFYIHDIVKDWSDEYNALSGARLRDVRKRFTDFFSVEIDKINHLIQSKQSSRGIRLFGHDVMNLRKLLKDSHLWDRQTYSSYKNVAVQDKQVIEKFIPDLALAFYQNMLAATRKMGEPHVDAIIHSRIGSVHTNIHGNLAEGFAMYEQAERELLKKGDTTELAMLYQHIGWNYHLQGHKKIAITIFGAEASQGLLYMLDHFVILSPHSMALANTAWNLEKSHEMIKGLGMLNSTMAMINFASLGIVHTSFGNIEKGMDFHYKAIELCKRLLGNQYSLGSYYNNLAISYRVAGDMENALKYTELGLRIKREFIVGPEKSVVLSLNNLAMLYASVRDDTNMALTLLDQARHMMTKLPFSALMEGLTMDNYCQLHIKTKTYSEGVPFCEAAVGVNRKYKPRHVVLAESLINYAKTLYGLAKHSDSSIVLREALSMKDIILNQMPKSFYLYDVYEMLVRVEMAMGSQEASKEFHKSGLDELKRLEELHERDANLEHLESIRRKRESLNATFS